VDTARATVRTVGSALRVLVTGGAGFFASHVVDALIRRGDEVLVVDDLSTGDRANLNKAAELRVVDVSEAGALERAIGAERLDAVVHCAAKTKVVESMEKEDLYRRVIVGGTANVLRTASGAGATVFVNCSTGGAIYGETPVCADESVAVRPASNYGRFKAEAEELVGSSGLHAVSLRFANIYGPRQRRDLEGGVVAIFIGCWKRGEPITLFGDGHYERDYLYVSDAVAAVLAALGRRHRGVYNVGTGVATSVSDLVRELSGILGPPPGVRRAPARPAEVDRGCVDPAKARREGLWSPRVALGEGLRLTAVAEGALPG